MSCLSNCIKKRFNSFEPQIKIILYNYFKKEMKMSKIEITILKEEIETEICKLQKEIIEFQGLDQNELENKWYYANGIINSINKYIKQ